MKRTHPKVLTADEKAYLRDLQRKRRAEVPPPNRDHVSLGDEYRYFNGLHVNRELTYNRLVSAAHQHGRHDCGPACVTSQRLDVTKVFNPYTVPMDYGFTRCAFKYGDTITIGFVTPCKKIVSSPLQVIRYLETVKLHLDIDHFTFSPNFILQSNRIRDNGTFVDDVTVGRESRPVSCINTLQEPSQDDKLNNYFQPLFRYVKERVVHHEISVDDDEFENFRTCCSCENDCVDSDTCECRMLTRNSNCGENTGYIYKRLETHHKFGIYECNDHCSCSSKCLNRVVQNGIKVRVQVFKTQHMGWGLRSLHFIPKGTFVCAYNGHLIDQEIFARDYSRINEEYLADLDYVEMAGAEADVANPSRDQIFKHDRSKLLSVDGSRISNVGRYFNHSCNPNLFVQSVFIETHDMRWNHMALFTSRDINPFEELTWDYNYLVGSDDERRLFCKCEATVCRMRLL